MQLNLDFLNQINQNTLMQTLKIEYTSFSGDTLSAKMPVGVAVHQPMGLLHGGASAALAESVGSMLSAAQNDMNLYGIVGTNLNIYHLNSMTEGTLNAHASFIRKGKSMHVIRVDMENQNGKQIAYALLSTKVILLRK